MTNSKYTWYKIDEFDAQTDEFYRPDKIDFLV